MAAQNSDETVRIFTAEQLVHTRFRREAKRQIRVAHLVQQLQSEIEASHQALLLEGQGI